MMKKQIFISCLVMIFAALSLSAQKIGTNPLKAYRIVYSIGAEDEVGMDAAKHLQQVLSEKTGVELAITADNANAAGREILLGSTRRKESLKAYAAQFAPFEYKVYVQSGKLIIAAGGCWAMNKAADLVADALSQGNLAASFRLEGTVEGEFLFPRDAQTNLRILDNNVWDYSGKPVPEVWKEAGEDCTDSVRGPQFAQLVRAYMPDVIGFQEFSRPMAALFGSYVSQYGYKETLIPEARNDTPVWYNEHTVELIESEYTPFTPLLWSNHKSKSFTWAAFKLKSNGKPFIVISTHLWWKSEKVQAGSNTARAAQTHLILATAQYLKSRYPDSPVFLVGDMNCHEKADAMQLLINAGFTPCYKIATVSTDEHNGHHRCGPKGFGRDGGNRTRAEAIDHCFLWNGGQTEIRHFKCDMSAFIVKITDHYPNIIDAVL